MKLTKKAKMFDFIDVYRRLNIFLLICCVCPFLQSKKSRRFECHRKYLLYACIVLLIHSSFITYLSIYRIKSLMRSISLVRVLKLGRTCGNAYALFFVISQLLLCRHSHATFFNKLFHFDTTYNKLVKPSIRYQKINRLFWIEITVFSIYLIICYIIEIVFNENMKNWRYWSFWTCEISEQIGYSVIVFHMKNSVHNLIFRYRRINYLLKTMLRKSSLNNVLMSDKKFCQQFEYIAHMYDLLSKARDSLQEAFASALLFIYTYNMFAVALSTYIVINAIVHEAKQRDQYHFQHTTAKFFGYELPLIAKDFYLTASFHFLGNMVINRNYFIIFIFD